MKSRTSVVIQALIIGAVGLVFLWFYVAGRMEVYLVRQGTFQEQALLAGVILGLVALFLLFTAGKKDVCCHDHHEHDHADCDHDHDHAHDHGDETHGHDDALHHHHEPDTLGGLAVTGLVILVPLLTAAFLTPDAYSKYWNEKNGLYSETGVVGEAPEAFDLRKQARENPGPSGSAGEGEPEGNTAAANAGWGPYTIDDFKAQVDANADGEYLMDVVSIFYTGGDEEVQNVVKGLPVETMGQVMPEKVRNPDGNRIRVFRLMMNCCIADARPVSVPVEFADGLPQFKEMGWYKIHGTIDYEQWDEFTIPVLKATRLEPTSEPEQGAFGRRQ